MGFMSSAHCVGMCGGIMGALSMAIPAEAKTKRWWILLTYNLGRLLSYGVMGLLIGLFAAQLAEWGALTPLRWLAGLLLIMAGLYIAQWWQGLVKIEALGRYLWAYLQPFGKALMPVNSLPKAFLLGVIWGWLPCGLVYSALMTSMAQANAVDSGIAMVAFGIATLPSVLAAGVLAQGMMKLFRLPVFKNAMAILFILFGLWTFWGASGHDHSHHHESTAAGTSTASAPEMDHSQMHHGDMDHSVMNHDYHMMESGSSVADSSSSAASNMDHSHHHME